MMGSVKEYYCAECGRTDERVALVNNCPVFTKHCPMRNKVEQVDDLLTKPRDVGKILQPLPADPTNPTHYRQGDIECIEAIEAATQGLTGIEAYCTGNAVKYLWRWKLKNGTEDLQKAMWHIDRMIGD